MVRRSAVIDSNMQAEWSMKRLVWVPHEIEGFMKASIIEDHSETVLVEYVDTGVRHKLSKDDCQKMNPPKYDKVSKF
jgi:hypothetical protein